MGPSLLVLNPAHGSAPATLELRGVDMRDIFADMNVIAEPPQAEMYQKSPAGFGKADTLAPLLDVSLQERGRSLDLTVHYDDRKATMAKRAKKPAAQQGQQHAQQRAQAQDQQNKATFNKAFGACLEGRGYSVK